MSTVAAAVSPRGEVVLGDRDGILELRVNGVFVMDTAETTSERALATQALALSTAPHRVLVGGLGLGFTAAELLLDQRLHEVDVIEIEQAVVDWMTDGTIPHGPALLADDRLTVVVGDVAQVLARAGDQSYDLILLDVDNGPGYLVHAANAALYGELFIECCLDVLRPGGVLAIWAANRAPELYGVMQDTFGNAELHPYEVQLQDRAEQYLLYVSRKG